MTPRRAFHRPYGLDSPTPPQRRRPGRRGFFIRDPGHPQPKGAIQRSVRFPKRLSFLRRQVKGFFALYAVPGVLRRALQFRHDFQRPGHRIALRPLKRCVFGGFALAPLFLRGEAFNFVARLPFFEAGAFNRRGRFGGDGYFGPGFREPRGFNDVRGRDVRLEIVRSVAGEFQRRSLRFRPASLLKAAFRGDARGRHRRNRIAGREAFRFFTRHGFKNVGAG